jgi:hypothetical protein
LDKTSWSLTDLLGRPMGQIVKRDDGQFEIVPMGKALETLEAIKRDRFPSLDAALTAIEIHTRGTCHRNFGEDKI